MQASCEMLMLTDMRGARAQVWLHQVGERGAAAAAARALRRARLHLPLRHDPCAQQVRFCWLLLVLCFACSRAYLQPKVVSVCPYVCSAAKGMFS